MASSSKSDLVSGSPDGHAYSSGQRGPYSAASLERPGSFRDGGESYTMFPASSSSRLPSAQMDSVNLLHSLVMDFRAAGLDQKISRPDVKKSISSIIGTSPEESASTPIIGRNLPGSIEELKRLRSNISDGQNKAREVGRTCATALMKIDRCYPNVSRKRSRGEGSSSERSGTLLSGGSVSKAGPQGHLHADDVELGPQRGEERAKNAVQNRRMRTSMVDMDSRTVGLSNRGSGPVDRSSDPSKAANAGPAVPEEKIRGLPTSIDGWEKPKMKKKRSAIKSDVSASVISSRSVDGDREQKQGIQHKLGNDARPRIASSPGFRSGPVPSGSVMGKADLLSVHNGLGGRSLNRSEQDCRSHPINKRDRQAPLDKEIVNLKVVNKPNDREDDIGANTTSMPKVNGSARGPRSNSGSSLKSSPNIQRLQGNSDDWEHPSGTSKLNTAGGSGNSKRTKSTHSLSPPITPWGGQRPQKIQRSARKSNLIPIITSNDGAVVPGSVDNASINEDSLGLSRRASNASIQNKRGDHGPLTGYEGDESGVAEKKLKDKLKRPSELDESHGPGLPKIATLGHPSKRNKFSVDEDIGDAARRQGRIGRCFTPARPSTPATIDKLENAPTTKQRSVRTVSERNESKSGRPLIKKLSERKGNTRPRHLTNNVLSDSPGQSEDDHDELLAAANAALSTRSACASPFWKQVEPFFSFLTMEDVAYLNQEIRLQDDATASRSIDGDESQKSKVSLEYISQPSTPAASNKDDHSALSNGCGLNGIESDVGMAWETSHVEPILDQLVQGIGVQGGVSLCQRLLQSIVDEEKIENITNNIYKSEGHPFDVHAEGGWKSHSQVYNMEPSMHSENTGRGPNGLRVDSGWKYHDELPQKSNNVMAKTTTWPEFQYSEMCINDRILIELSEIGVSLEPVPDLAQSEDEDISGEICKLEGRLNKEVVAKKNLLMKLEQAVKSAKDSQQREFSRRALDRLALMAYDKYMAFCGSNGSSSKNINRAGKHAALSFVKRTLARCQNYEETGTSCFDEPAFRDMFISVTSQRNDADSASQDLNTLPKAVQRANTLEKGADASRTSSHLTDLSFAKEDPWTNNVKQRELLLDEVVGSITGSTLKTSGLGTSIASGTKGKRSERDREGKGQNRDSAKSGRLSSSNVKGERKNKTKPKQKTVNLSASVNGGLCKDTWPPTKITPDSGKKNGSSAISRRDDAANGSHDAEMPDLSGLALPDMEGDFSGWLNIDDDGLQDLDLMGLEIPMDDINDINLMI